MNDPLPASPQPSSAARVHFYSVPAAAKLIGTAPVTLYRAIRDGEFPAIRVRGRLVVPALALDEMSCAAVTNRTVVDAAAWCGPRPSAHGSAEAS